LRKERRQMFDFLFPALSLSLSLSHTHTHVVYLHENLCSMFSEVSGFCWSWKSKWFDDLAGLESYSSVTLIIWLGGLGKLQCWF
jgi:hypothetical protein